MRRGKSRLREAAEHEHGRDRLGRRLYPHGHLLVEEHVREETIEEHITCDVGRASRYSKNEEFNVTEAELAIILSLGCIGMVDV